MSESTAKRLRLPPGAPMPLGAAPGAVLVLAPGEHSGGLFVEGPLRVEGEGHAPGAAPTAVIHAHGKGAAVHAAGEEGTLQLVGLVLKGGRAELGAALCIDGPMRVEAEGCVFEAGRADQGGETVGGLRGALHLRGCRLAGSALLTGILDAVFEDCVVEGDLVLREGAALRLVGGEVRGHIDLRGTTTRAPSVHLEGGAKARLKNHAAHPGTVSGAGAPRP